MFAKMLRNCGPCFTPPGGAALLLPLERCDDQVSSFQGQCYKLIFRVVGRFFKGTNTLIFQKYSHQFIVLHLKPATGYNLLFEQFLSDHLSPVSEFMNESGRRDHCYASHARRGNRKAAGRLWSVFSRSCSGCTICSSRTRTHTRRESGPSLVGISPPHRRSPWGVCCSAPLQGPGNAGVRHFFPLTSIFGLDIGGPQPRSFSTVFQPCSFPASTAPALLLQIRQHNLRPTEAMRDPSEATRIWARRQGGTPAAGPQGSNQCSARRVDSGHR